MKKKTDTHVYSSISSFLLFFLYAHIVIPSSGGGYSSYGGGYESRGPPPRSNRY
jgi:hypothetical protein